MNWGKYNRTLMTLMFMINAVPKVEKICHPVYWTPSKGRVEELKEKMERR